MAIKQLKNPAAIPSEDLEDWGPVEEPLSERVSQLRGISLNEHPDGSQAGLCECTPGKWVRKIMEAEISSFLKGHALFHPKDGETIEIKAGDSVYFDDKTEGIWEVLETTRKGYLIYQRD